MAEVATPPSISVIIVNHNRADLLRKCIASVLQQTLPPIEILVVDNASTDGSRGLVRGLQVDSVRLLALESNLGFAAANNVAIREAAGDFVALLNNDATARSDWLESLMRTTVGDSRVGMWASKILTEDGERIDKAGHRMFLDGQNRGRGSGQEDRGQFDALQECFFPDGCAALYRSQVLREVEGFDEDFFAYADDADLGLRARWLGWMCLYVPDAVVYHSRSSTLGPYSPLKIYWVERNRLWLTVKNFPLPLLLLTPILTAYRWLWNLAAALAGSGAAGRFRDQLSFWGGAGTVVRAVLDGIRGIPVMWPKRAMIRRTRRISSLEFLGCLWRFRMSAREISFHDPG